MKRWLAGLVFLLLPVLAEAAPATKPPVCGKSGDWDSRCDWMAAGEPDLPTVAARGDEVIRIQGLSGLIYGDYLMEVRHPHDGGYRLVIHNPRAPDASLARQVSRRDWYRLVRMRIATLTSHLRYAGSPPPGAESFCDAPGIAIDSVLRGTADHFETFDCTYPAIKEFYQNAPAFLYGLVPDCRKLASAMRMYCGSLSGDMASARAAMPYVAQLEHWGCGPRDADGVDPGKFIAGDATLTVADSAGVMAGTWRGPEIGKALCARSFAFTAHHVVGDGAQVRVDGTVRRYWEEPPVSKGSANTRIADAPSTQLWHIDHGVATLERWSVAGFGPAR